MEEIIVILKELHLLEALLRIASASFVALGFVFMTGRMLGITKSDLAKNIEAIIIIFIFNCAYTKLFNELPDYELYFDIIVNSLISIVFYVGVCWKFYPRIDNYLNKKIASDIEKNKNKPTKRRPKSEPRKSTTRKRK